MDTKITEAVIGAKMLEISGANITSFLASSEDPVDRAAVEELVAASAWDELNDRFFKTLAFGTGGLRGRTVGRIVTKAERGSAAEGERPEHPCVGTNGMNLFNVSRATQGLVRYTKQWIAEHDPERRPAMAISHDTRHFSREFAEYCAKVCQDHGVDVYLTESCRSTPEVSFAVRLHCCTSGIMLTASHNPSHDNGYKAYFDDGCQIVQPHASGIISEVNAITSASYEVLPEDQRGTLTILGKDLDELYMKRLETLMLQPELLERAKDLKVVFTNLHGTGGIIITQMLKRLGFNYITVPEQDTQDGDFPTVKSPNPENSSALQMGIDLAEKEQADIVIGTDPDCDRMGVVVRNSAGEMVLLNGNQIGSLLATYRTKMMLNMGILTDANKANATLVKTLVTTNLQAQIAAKLGISCVNTLTGFKYIGEKLTKYEKAVPLPEGKSYGDLTEDESRDLRLAHSKYFVFGGEESYGYLGGDFIRDKDGNAAVVMFCELAAFAVARGLTIPDLMNEVYCEFGYYQEALESVVMEGAEGAGMIQKLANSYTQDPPKEVDGSTVTSMRNFAEDDFTDEEGDAIPKEKMIIVDLADGRSFAVRPSGTEPKIKYYLFSQNPAPDTGFTQDEVDALKVKAQQSIESLWAYLEKDINVRLD